MTVRAQAKRDVIENTKLCATQGWKATFHLSSGETIETVYITGTDWTNEAISVERVGERHLPARILYLSEVDRVDPVWT